MTLKMEDDFMSSEGLQAVILSEGSFLDMPDQSSGKVYTIRSWTLRLNSQALNLWHTSRHRQQEVDEPDRSYQRKELIRQTDRETLENYLLDVIGYPGLKKGFSFVQIVSEVFAACVISDVED